MKLYSEWHWDNFAIGFHIIPADKALFVDFCFYTIGFHKDGVVG